MKSRRAYVKLNRITFPDHRCSSDALFGRGVMCHTRLGSHKERNMKVRQVFARRIFTLFTFFIVWFSSGIGQITSRTLLNHLRGEWVMTGTVLNKPVTYDAQAVWVLQDQFLSLHMKDVTLPPAYEATLYLGIDSSKNQFVVHWLDSFGGAGARVVGLGPLSTEKIEIVYPYSEGKFRNLFKYNSEKDEWTLVVESEGKNGHWSVFAHYNILRKR